MVCQVKGGRKGLRETGRVHARSSFSLKSHLDIFIVMLQTPGFSREASIDEEDRVLASKFIYVSQIKCTS